MRFLSKNSIFLITINAFILVSCSENTPKKPENTAGTEREYGSDIFRKNCVSCHGAEGNMGLNGAFDLSKSALSLDEKIAVITNGRKVMTPFKQLLSPDEIKSVAEYTETLKK